MIKQVFFNNINITYFLLSIIYLFVFNKQLIKNNFIKQSKYNNILLNLFVLLIMGLTIFNNIFNYTVKMFIFIFVFILYNKFILRKNIRFSIVVSLLYGTLGCIIELLFSFTNNKVIELNKNYIFSLVINQAFILAIFLLTLYIIFIPLINSNIFFTICYPTNKRWEFTYNILTTSLLLIYAYNFYFNDFKNVDDTFSFVIIKIIFIFTVGFLLWFIYFTSIKLNKYRKKLDIEDSLIDVWLKANSAEKEDKFIKNMNDNIRQYSSLTKADIIEKNLDNIDDNELYNKLKKSLENFYREYSTGDDIINNILSERQLICENLNIEYCVKFKNIDFISVDLEKLKYLYAMVALAIDVFIIETNKNKQKDKKIVIDIDSFNYEKIYFNIVSNITNNCNKKEKKYYKNKVVSSNKYQYLYAIIKQYNGSINFNVTDNNIGLVVNINNV